MKVYKTRVPDCYEGREINIPEAFLTPYNIQQETPTAVQPIYVQYQRALYNITTIGVK